MSEYIPYGRQTIDEDDIRAVVDVLRGDWLTTGPAVESFERDVASFVGVSHAVAVSSGTAALHSAMHAIGVGPGDEVIIPTMTFAATANAVLYVGATPVFADVDQETLLISPESVAAKITPKTRAVVAVDYAGQPCDYPALRNLCETHGLILASDASHSLGASLNGTLCAALADISVLSFHPVKPLTTAEGGMVLTDNGNWAARMHSFRNHGITTDHRQRSEKGVWFYEMQELGFNYRLSDLQCALGSSQLRRLPEWITRRQTIAALYDRAFESQPHIRPLSSLPGVSHGYHLYVVRVPQRDLLFSALRDAGIGCNIHYIPVHLHPYYRQLGHVPGECPVAEGAYAEILSLPVYPTLSDEQTARVARTLIQALDSLEGL